MLCEAHRYMVPNVAPCAAIMLSPANTNVCVLEPLWSGDNFLQERLLVLMAEKRVTVPSCGETPTLPVNPNAPLKTNQHPVAELLQCVLDTLASPFSIRECVSSCSKCLPKWLVQVIGLDILKLLVFDTCVCLVK